MICQSIKTLFVVSTEVVACTSFTFIVSQNLNTGNVCVIHMYIYVYIHNCNIYNHTYTYMYIYTYTYCIHTHMCIVHIFKRISI